MKVKKVWDRMYPKKKAYKHWVQFQGQLRYRRAACGLGVAPVLKEDKDSTKRGAGLWAQRMALLLLWERGEQQDIELSKGLDNVRFGHLVG